VAAGARAGDGTSERDRRLPGGLPVRLGSSERLCDRGNQGREETRLKLAEYEACLELPPTAESSGDDASRIDDEHSRHWDLEPTDPVNSDTASVGDNRRLSVADDRAARDIALVVSRSAAAFVMAQSLNCGVTVSGPARTTTTEIGPGSGGAGPCVPPTASTMTFSSPSRSIARRRASPPRRASARRSPWSRTGSFPFDVRT
jgi:hypothetical protein